jgi:hypothetical protein
MANEVVTHLTATDADVQAACKRAEKSLNAYAAKAGQIMRGVALSIAGAWAGMKVAGMAAFAEEQDALKRMESVLKSTGGAVGYTSQQLQQLAADLQKTTNYSNQATMGAMSLMLTFTSIKGEVFNDAIKAVQDISTIMQGDMKSAAIQVGKALNDPIKGVGALAEVGVSFTEQQKAQIKAMQEAGNIAGAQKVILKELAVEFGGAAEAMAKPSEQLKNRIQDLAVQVGAALRPALTAVTSAISAVVSWMENLTSGQRAAISSVLTWTAGIAAAVLIVPKLISAISAVITVIKALTTAQIVQQALSGPAGWAALAAGAAVAAGAVYGLNKYFQSLGDASEAAGKQATGALKSTSQAANETAAALAKVNDILRERREKQDEAYGAFVDKYQSPVTKAKRERFEAPVSEYSKSAADRAAYRKFIAEQQQSFTGDISTTAEQVRETLAGLKEAYDAGLISMEQYNRALAKTEEGMGYLSTLQKYQKEVKKLTELFDAGYLTEKRFLELKKAAGQSAYGADILTAREQYDEAMKQLEAGRSAGAVGDEQYERRRQAALQNWKGSQAKTEDTAGRFEDLGSLYKRVSSSAAGSPEARQEALLEKQLKTGELTLAELKAQNDKLEKLLQKPGGLK